MTNNTPIRIYISRTEKRIAFKIKSGNQLKLLTPETVKLLRSTDNNASKSKKKKP